jgi:hypothetical protein
MTTKERFRLGDSVVIGSRKSDWYGKIGKVVALYEKGRCGVSYRGEPTRVYKTTSLCLADKRYEALVGTNVDWRKAIKDELTQLNDHGIFINPRNNTKSMSATNRPPEAVKVETTNDDSHVDTGNNLETNTGEPKSTYGKKVSNTSGTGGWTWSLPQEQENNNVTMHTTTMTDDNDSVDQKQNSDTESTMSQEYGHARDYQTTLLIERIEELAGENTILRMQNSKKNRIITILLEDFKSMDIHDAYFPDDQLK